MRYKTDKIMCYITYITDHVLYNITFHVLYNRSDRVLYNRSGHV